MRIGYGTWGMRDVGIEEAIPALAQIGYTGIELAVTPGRPTDLVTLDEGARRRILQLLAEHDLVLTAIAGHTSMCETDPDRASRNLARLRASIAVAADLRSDGELAIMASLVGGRTAEWPNKREMLAERVLAVGEYAASLGVILAVEPHCGTALDTPTKAVWLLEQVNHPAVRLNFDISHFDIIGIGIDECVPLMAPYSVHTHVKDQRGIYPHHEFLTPGSGPFDFVAYLEAMHAAGYDGFVVNEVSVMVQEKAGYDPFADAALSYWALVHAFNSSGVPLDS